MVKNKSFTLLELVIVIIITGVLATQAVTQYGSYKETTLDKEAKANLKLIVAAEKIYRMETSFYYDSGTTQPDAITNINTDLRLLLSNATNRNWNYLTTANNTTTPVSCCGQATRNGGNSRNWRMRYNATAPDDEPVAGSTCP